METIFRLSHLYDDEHPENTYIIIEKTYDSNQLRIQIGK
jgi:hypothetical protein